MINKIEQWIDKTLDDFSDKKVSCEVFSSQLDGYYPKDFLEKSSFVVVDKVPTPDFPGLDEIGLSELKNMDPDGLAYKDTYFVKERYKDRIALHFHELVHVYQWQYLGARAFIDRYVQEITTYGYENAPLEKMACDIEKRFSGNKSPFDVLEYVKNELL